MRYALANPVEGGDQFWEISDTQRDFPVASIHKDVPHAEEFAHMILAQLNAQ